MDDKPKLTAVSIMEAARETVALEGPDGEGKAPTYQNVFPEAVCTLSPPLILPGDTAIAWTARTQALPPAMMARFHRPIVAHCGAVFMPDEETFIYERRAMYPMRVNGQDYGECLDDNEDYLVKPVDAAPMPGACLVMGLMPRMNVASWFHWTIEMLPRFMVAEAFPYLAELPIIMNDDLSPAQEDSLRALGVNPDRIVPNSRQVLRPEVAYCPSFTGRDYLPSPKAVAWFRKKVLSHFAIKSNGAPQGAPRGSQRLLYLSRADAPRRHISNDGEVAQTLSQMGFEYFLASKKSFREQVEAFAHARIVVAAHGAGMANIIFCQPGTLIIEFYPHIPGAEAGISFYYPGLSNVCGHIHAVLRGEEYDDNHNYHVDPAKLADLITRMLNGGDLDRAKFQKEVEDGLIISQEKA